MKQRKLVDTYAREGLPEFTEEHIDINREGHTTAEFIETSTQAEYILKGRECADFMVRVPYPDNHR